MAVHPTGLSLAIIQLYAQTSTFVRYVLDCYQACCTLAFRIQFFVFALFSGLPVASQYVGRRRWFDRQFDYRYRIFNLERVRHKAVGISFRLKGQVTFS